MKRIILLTALGLATPAFASDQPVALDDAALEKVSGGSDSVPVASVNTNVSPIVVIQNAYAITYQNAITGNSAWGRQQGHGKGKDKAKKNGHAATPFAFMTGNVAQTATTTALNIATINYSVTQK